MIAAKALHVDIVGSFLRPPGLKDAFARHGAGKLDDAGLHAAQDAAIRDLVKAEERHGLPVVSDGEFRRRNFNQSFAVVAGMERWYDRMGAGTVIEKPEVEAGLKRDVGNEFRLPVTRKLKLERNAPLEEYQFVARLSERAATTTLLSTDRMRQRYAYEESLAVYPGGADEFVADVVRVQQEMVRGLADAGCGYVHIDAPSYTSYVDTEMLAGMQRRGEDPERNLAASIAADSAVVNAAPGVTFGIHLCRGNAQGMWHRRGAYDRIAEQLFNGLAHHRFLLEYDDERSGGFEPLRFVPKGKTVVLGLITTKRPEVESADELRRRIEEAAKVLPLEQLALSPQCGFSSGLEGNPLSEAEQWRKIDRMMEVAESVWGR